MKFCGYDLTWITTKQWGLSIITPIIAGVSAWLLCVAQNASNVLQAEQSKLNKYGMMIFSVGLSLYLGCFVYAGVALYWTASNIFAILQLYLLNWAINPKKYVDYEDLEESKKELAALEGIGVNSGKKRLLRKLRKNLQRLKLLVRKREKETKKILREKKLIIKSFSLLLINILSSIQRAQVSISILKG